MFCAYFVNDWCNQGAAGFYKGVASPLVGQMFFNAVQFLAYGRAKDLVASKHYSQMFAFWTHEFALSLFTDCSFLYFAVCRWWWNDNW